MAQYTVDFGYHGHNYEQGELAFFASVGDNYVVSRSPFMTNMSGEIVLNGWCGNWNNVSTDAMGVVRISRAYESKLRVTTVSEEAAEEFLKDYLHDEQVELSTQSDEEAEDEAEAHRLATAWTDAAEQGEVYA